MRAGPLPAAAMRCRSSPTAAAIGSSGRLQSTGRHSPRTSLPPGLVNGGPPCDGDLTGTPTRAGTYAFTVQIRPGDNGFGQQAGPSGTQQLTITIGTGSSDRLALSGTLLGSARLNMECNVDEPVMTFYASDANSGATYTVTETSTGTVLHTFTGIGESPTGQGNYILFAVPASTAATFPSGTNEGSITVTDTVGGSATIPVRKASGC